MPAARRCWLLSFRLAIPSLGCGATCVAFGSTLDWTFNILTYSAATSIHTADQLDMTGQGILTMTGHDPTLTNWWRRSR